MEKKVFNSEEVSLDENKYNKFVFIMSSLSVFFFIYFLKSISSISGIHLKDGNILFYMLCFVSYLLPFFFMFKFYNKDEYIKNTTVYIYMYCFFNVFFVFFVLLFQIICRSPSIGILYFFEIFKASAYYISVYSLIQLFVQPVIAVFFSIFYKRESDNREKYEKHNIYLYILISIFLLNLALPDIFLLVKKDSLDFLGKGNPLIYNILELFSNGITIEG